MEQRTFDRGRSACSRWKVESVICLMMSLASTWLGVREDSFDVTGAGVELDRSFVGSKLVEGQSH